MSEERPPLTPELEHAALVERLKNAGVVGPDGFAAGFGAQKPKPIFELDLSRAGPLAWFTVPRPRAHPTGPLLTVSGFGLTLNRTEAADLGWDLPPHQPHLQLLIPFAQMVQLPVRLVAHSYCRDKVVPFEVPAG